MQFRIVWCLLAWASVSTAAAAEPVARPNVVLFLADDLGWRDTSVYGSEFYPTPNVARLAARGMRFTNAYAASPLCSPTRASILTGQYPGRLRFTTPAGHLPQAVLDPVVPARARPAQRAVTPQTRTRLPNEYFTIAEAMKGSGYRTGFFGKWHLGHAPYLPEQQGFDVVVGGRHHPGPPGGYFAPWPIDTISDGSPGEHITDRLAVEAVKFIRANRERPFLLCFWDYSVHAPFQAKEELIAKYRARIDPDDTQRNPVMAAMIEPLDDAVGKLLGVLDELDLAKDTLFVFTSDNGGNMYNVVEGLPPTNNAPLRAGKGSIYEGGVRVPLIVSWPGRVVSGSRSDAIVTSVDYYPTLLDVLGLDPQPGQILDGVSILPVLRGTAGLQREAIFCHFPHYVKATDNLPSTSVRVGDWKLYRFYADGPQLADRHELYNLATDIGERRDLAAAQPARVRELDALIERHNRATRSLVPRPNPAFAPDGGVVAGWTGNQYAKLSIEGDRLIVESSGNDPFITLRAVPKLGKPATFVVRMKSSARGNAQVFWASKAAPRFHRSHSSTFAVTHDGALHEYRAPVQLTSRLTGLRLDPATGPGRIEIESMALVGAKGEAIATWRFDAKASGGTKKPARRG